MKNISVPYGKGTQSAIIPDHISIQVIDPPKAKAADSIEQLITQALDNPVESQLLEDMVTPNDRIIIIVNDHTRPGPYPEMLRAIISRMEKVGVGLGNITILFATGSHRAPTADERISLVGEEYARSLLCVAHDCTDNDSLVYLGETSSGMPIYINKLAVEATFVITLGLIAPHQTAGFSGGRKSIVPGISGMQTLRIHHSFPYRPFAPSAGVLEGNLFHQSAVEAAQKVGVKFMLNAVQDPQKQCIAFVAGDIYKSHLVGAEICRKACTVNIEEKADIVVSSPGGAPRDLNLYQSQKALAAAEQIINDDGVFILVADCADGLGEGVFHQWMSEAGDAREVIARFEKEGYSIGSNKAFLFARALLKGKVIVVSEKLSARELEEMHLEWAPSLQAAVDKAIEKKSGRPNRIIVMPRAVSVIPKIVN
jgi:nickel-dependent lactate racemase